MNESDSRDEWVERIRRKALALSPEEKLRRVADIVSQENIWRLASLNSFNDDEWEELETILRSARTK